MINAIRIHGHPLSGHAHRVSLFAALAGIAHEEVTIDLLAGEHKQAPFLKLNPAGQVPVIEDGETVVTDSNAILVYLAKKYAPDWLPEAPEAAAAVQRWLTAAAGEVAFGAATARLITVFGAPLDADRALAVAASVNGKLEAHLAENDFLAGSRPTIADVAVYSYTAHGPEGNVDLSPYPNLRRWIAAVEALPGFVAMQSTSAGLVAA